MKFGRLSLFLGAAIALESSAIFSRPAAGQRTTTFFCGTYNGVPTTVARASRGNVPIIRWVSGSFNLAGYTPQRRCQEVSQRFENYYQNGTLKYISSGYFNGYPVICIASEKRGPCTGILFTLRREDNPNQVLGQLVELQSLANGPISQSSAIAFIDERYYIDIFTFIRLAPSTIPDYPLSGVSTRSGGASR